MRNCLECKWCHVGWVGAMTPGVECAHRQRHWMVCSTNSLKPSERAELARAIKTAEKCPDFEGEETKT